MRERGQTVTLQVRRLANGGTGLQPMSQSASCGSGQSLSYVDSEKEKGKDMGSLIRKCALSMFPHLNVRRMSKQDKAIESNIISLVVPLIQISDPEIFFQCFNRILWCQS